MKKLDQVVSSYLCNLKMVNSYCGSKINYVLYDTSCCTLVSVKQGQPQKEEVLNAHSQEMMSGIFDPHERAKTAKRPTTVCYLLVI